jgi:cell division protein FtsN
MAYPITRRQSCPSLSPSPSSPPTVSTPPQLIPWPRPALLDRSYDSAQRQQRSGRPPQNPRQASGSVGGDKVRFSGINLEHYADTMLRCTTSSPSAMVDERCAHILRSCLQSLQLTSLPR